LRTGQPGQAPEKQVVREYDINDYKEKTELTSQKLYTSIYTALSSYRALISLDANRRGLVKVIQASTRIYEQRHLDKFIQGVLEQVVALLFIDREAVLVCNCAVGSVIGKSEQVILAAIGEDKKNIGRDPREVLPQEVNERVQQVFQTHQEMLDEYSFTGYVETPTGIEAVIHVSSASPLNVPDHELLELFFRNITVGMENLNLRKNIEETQSEIVYLLGDVVESRSNETGNHVRRVAEVTRQLALLNGMGEEEADMLHIAAPLHDIGKIGIPDAILNKEGKLNDEEWEVMKSHTEIGKRILSSSHRPVMKAAALIAHQHHENWDGSGYPSALSENEIHIYARIVAIADVMDALCSDRCYKTGWTMEQAMEFLQKQRGLKFDPALIDLVMANRAIFEAIRTRYPEH
jgi:response regulator RpfG family c-di-GMP phosphodiesterase